MCNFDMNRPQKKHRCVFYYVCRQIDRTLSGFKIGKHIQGLSPDYRPHQLVHSWHAPTLFSLLSIKNNQQIESKVQTIEAATGA